MIHGHPAHNEDDHHGRNYDDAQLMLSELWNIKICIPMLKKCPVMMHTFNNIQAFSITLTYC